MKDLFAINTGRVERVTIYGSNFYFIDKFYKHPRKVRRWILKHQSSLHKNHERGYNGIHFEDRRHVLRHPGMKDVNSYLSNLCRYYEPLHEGNEVVTNLFKFKKCEFNNYKNNYWWPHLDVGYTGIVFFDKAATNLYRHLGEPGKEIQYLNNTTEHESPWRSTNEWEKILTLNGEFNRMILFEASKFYHGLDISDDRYTKKFRMNQVIFLKKQNVPSL